MLIKITNLDETLVERLKELTGERTAAKAVSKAASELPVLLERLSYYSNQNDELKNKLAARQQELRDIRSALKLLKEI